MATLRSSAQVDENEAGERQRAGKPHAANGRVQTRKALGDIGNLVGPFNTRCNVGKENAAAEKGDQKAVKPSGVLTRRSAAAAGVIIDEKVLGHLDKPRRQSLKSKGSETAAPAQADTAIGTRNSLTGLLVSRSQEATEKKSAASHVPDIDSGDLGDPLTVAEYATDIFAYYCRVEPSFRTAPDYMNSQADINDKMRAILIDWLVEVHLKFKLMPETLFLTINLIDRFLARQPISRKNLQLVGVTAMLIASKYEEIWAPEVRDFVYISDRAYTKEQILTMEKLILNTLKFNLTVPTANTFLCRFLKAAGRNKDTALATYAAYLVELSLPAYEMLKFSHSEIAAAAVLVASKWLKAGDTFPHGLEMHSGYALSELQSCAAALERLHLKAPKASLVAVFKKYSGSKFHEIAVSYGPGAASQEG